MSRAKVAPSDAPGSGHTSGAAAATDRSGEKVPRSIIHTFLRWMDKSTNEWKYLADTVPSKNLRTRLQTEWSTLGVVCSLLVTLAYSIFTVPPEAVMVGGTTQTVFVILCGSSVALNLGCVALSTFLMVQLNLMSDDEVTWFAITFQAYTGVNFVFFVSAVVFLFGTLMIIAVKMHGAAGVAVSCIIGGIVGLCMVMVLVLDISRKLNRSDEKPEGATEENEQERTASGKVGAGREAAQSVRRGAGALEDDD